MKPNSGRFRHRYDDYSTTEFGLFKGLSKLTREAEHGNSPRKPNQTRPVMTQGNLIAWLGCRSHRVQAPHQQQVHLSRTSSSDRPQELPVFHTLQSGRQKRVQTRTQRSLRREGTYTMLRIEPKLTNKDTKRKTTNALGDWPVSFGKKDMPTGTFTCCIRKSMASPDPITSK